MKVNPKMCERCNVVFPTIEGKQHHDKEIHLGMSIRKIHNNSWNGKVVQFT